MLAMRFSARSRLGAVVLACLGLTSAALAKMVKAPSQALISGELLPTCARITPLAMPGATFRTLTPDLPQLPDFVAGQPVEIAISPDGARALVANVQNDSVSLMDLASRKVIAEQDLRPGKINPKDAGKPGGSFPLSVAFLSDTSAYVGALRDREIIRLDIKGDAMTVANRIAIQGEPMKLRASPARRHLYVAADNSDTVVVIVVSSAR